MLAGGANAGRDQSRTRQGRVGKSRLADRRRANHAAFLFRVPRSAFRVRQVPRSAFALAQRAIVLGLSATVLIAFVAGVVEQRWKEGALRAQVEAGAGEVRAAEARNDELRRQLAASDPDAYRAYVEDVARRQLNLGYPDETVVLVSWSDPPPGANQAPTTSPATSATAPPENEARPATNWRRWWRFLVGE